MEDGPVSPLMSLDHVSVRFGGLLALSDVSFEVFANEIVGLIGPNGAGKTTAFNAACGFIPPTSGTVHFPALGHHNLRPNQLARAGVARTLQGVGLFGHLSVIENVMAGAISNPGGSVFSGFLGLPRATRHEKETREAAMTMLDRFGVAKYARSMPGGLPYGIAKKVSVARALVGGPRLLLLDEPASGLDEQEIDEFAEIIAGLKSQMSVLLVEHNMDFVMPLVERLIVLDFGEVIAVGSPAEISNNDAVLAAYLGVDG